MTTATETVPDAMAAIEAEAHQLEGTTDPAAPPPPPTAADTAAELLGALQLGRLMVAPGFQWWPEFGQVWSDSQLQQIAQAGGAVMDRHGWTMGAVLSEWGPYIGLIGATAPPALVTWQALKARKAEAERPRPTPAPPPPGAAP